MLGNLQIGSINGVGFMPVNLVINPEFTVNQRGAASRTAATGYNYDRWYYDGSSLLQGIENLNLRATTYVVSWSGSATCSYSLNTAASSSQGGQTFTSIANGGTLTISSLGSNNLWLKFSGTVSDLTNVMCVPSPAQTPFVPRQHQQELALCQRYYYRITANNQYAPFAYAYNPSTSIGYAVVSYPVPMRAAPTSIDYSNLGNSILGISTATIASASIITSTTAMAQITLNPSTSFTAGAASLTANTVAGYYGLTAEL